MLPDFEEQFRDVFLGDAGDEAEDEAPAEEITHPRWPDHDEVEPAPQPEPKYTVSGGSVFDRAGRRCYRFSTKAEAEACAVTLNEG
jgi:hypothetical protein